MKYRLLFCGLIAIFLVCSALSVSIMKQMIFAASECVSPPEQCNRGCAQYQVNPEAYNLCVNDCNTIYTYQSDWDAYNQCRAQQQQQTDAYNVNCSGALTPDQEAYCDAEKAKLEPQTPFFKPTTSTTSKITTKTLYVGSDIHYGDEVTAGKNEIKIVAFEDGSKITLNSGTSFTLINNNEVSTGLLSQLKFVIKKIQMKQFKVKTPTAVLAVRGTDFLTNTDDDGATTIKLIEGTVDVSDSNGKKKVELKTGYQVTVDKNGNVGTPKKLALTSDDNWYKKAEVFSDVSADHKYFDAIKYLKDKKIVQGYSDGSFKPANEINRAEFTKIIIATLTSKPAGSKCFSDVKDEWFAQSVCYAKNKGFIGGYADGTFKPTQSVKLAEALKIIMLALKTNLSKNVGANWFDVYMNTAKELKILANITDTDPAHVLNRGEMAEIIYRLKNL